jgi:hypothetical protein
MMSLVSSQLSVLCDENEHHTAVLYCTVCTSHLCEECSELTHATRTLARHRRVPLSDKPREKPKCPSHPSHVAEFTCLEDDCQTLHSGPGPIMCFICKDYGRHKNHKVRYSTSDVSFAAESRAVYWYSDVDTKTCRGTWQSSLRISDLFRKIFCGTIFSLINSKMN